MSRWESAELREKGGKSSCSPRAVAVQMQQDLRVGDELLSDDVIHVT